MGRAPCCDKANVKKGPWSPEEDSKLKDYIHKNGTGGNWIALPQKAGLKRCGKSCRLRWLNYLRPNIKHGEFSDEEDRIICSLYANIGSRWSIIAAQLPGRTDNDIKNYWNTKLKKKLMGLVPNHDHQRKAGATLSQSCDDDQNPVVVPFPSHESSYYRDLLSSSYYTSPAASTSTMSLTGLEQPITPNATNNYPCLLFQNQQQEASLMNMQYYYNMFASEASCSTSSDGSFGPAAASHSTEQLGFHQNYNNVSSSNGGLESDFQANKFNMQPAGCENMMSQNQYWSTAEKGSSGHFGQTPFMDYGLEDIKQLITTSNGVHHHHHEEMYYYY